MFILKNNLKCFRTLFTVNSSNALRTSQMFKFSTGNTEDDRPKMQPKIIQKIRKEDLKMHAEIADKADQVEEFTSRDIIESKEIKQEKKSKTSVKEEKKRGKEDKSRVPKIIKEIVPKDIRGTVQPYFLNKVKQDDIDPKTFSIAKLMEYNSMERRNKIKHIETTLILNKDLTKEMPKSEVKRKLSMIKDELVREQPKNL